MEKRTGASTDDAEEFSSGSMYLNSSDLELVHDTSDQTVGMRWTALAIPQGSIITAAYIQFSAKESQSEATNLTFRSQAADQAAAFGSGSHNISNRPRTGSSTTWTPAPWTAGQAGSNQRTPDLAAVIQEVVNRAGWASGNALAIIVTGTGHRTAYSYDGSSSASPLLHVEFTSGQGDHAPLVSASTSVFVAEGGTIVIPVAVSDPDSQAIELLTADFAGLPPNSGATFVQSANHRNGALTWTPDFSHAGSYAVTFTATNALSGSSSTAITVMNTDRPPVVSAPASASVAENGLLTIQVTAADPEGDGIPSLTASSLPAGAIFTPDAGNTSGTFSWAPTYDQAGSYTVAFVAANALTAFSTTDVTVSNTDRPPAVTVTPAAGVSENQSLAITVNVSDPDGDAVTLTASGLPSGATFAPVGWLSPNTTYYFALETADEVPHWSDISNVIARTTPPASNAVTLAWTAPGDDSLVGTALRYDLRYSSSPITITNFPNSARWRGMPAPVVSGATQSVQAGGDTTGRLAWTPGYASAGNYTVTFTATNALSGSASTSITVGNVDRPPVVTVAPTANVDEGSPLTLEVTASDPDGDAIATLAASNLPAGAAFTPGAGNATGTLQWTPAYGDSGSYPVTFTTGNALSGSASTIITVGRVPHVDRAPAVTVAPTASVDEGSPLILEVTASDPDGDAIATLAASNLPAGATFTPGAGNATGTLQWTPGYADAGGYTVTFTATNALSGSASTSITVGNVDRAPIVTAAPTASVDEGSPLTLEVTASDPDGDAIATLDATGLPPGATFTPGAGNATRTLQWTPAYGDSGSYPVTFTAGNALSASANTIITVGNADRPPVVTVASTASVDEGSPLTLEVTASDPDGDAIATLDAAGLPAGATFTPGAGNATGTLQWTPGYADAGSYLVTFTAGNALSASASTAITAGNVNRPPVGSLAVAPATGNAPLPVRLDASGSSDADGPIASFRFDFGDSSADETSSQSVVDHSYGAGHWTAKVIVTDSEGAVDSTTTEIVVGEASTPNLAANSSFEVNADGWSGTGGALLQVAAGGFEGLQSLLVVGPSTTAPFGVTDDPGWILGTPALGLHYHVAAWVRSATGTGWIQLLVTEFLEDAQTGSSAGAPSALLSPGWQLLQADVVTSSAGSQIRMQIIDTPTQEGESFQVDDVSMGMVSGGTTGVRPGAPPALGGPRAWVAPNPMRRSGVLHFVSTRSGPVSITLYDVRGRIVRKLGDGGWATPGHHQATMDGRDERGAPLPSGVYLYRVSLPERVMTGRIPIVR